MTLENKIGPIGPIVTISDTAYQKIMDIIKQQRVEGLFFRIYVQPSGGLQFGMALDSRLSDDDYYFKIKDLDVRVDRISIDYVMGASVDYIEDSEKKGFQISSPALDALRESSKSCESCSGDAGCCS